MRSINFFVEGKVVLTIDNVGWSFGSDRLSWHWADIKEGGPENVAEVILRDLAEDGYETFWVVRDFDFNNPPKLEVIRKAPFQRRNPSE